MLTLASRVEGQAIHQKDLSIAGHTFNSKIFALSTSKFQETNAMQSALKVNHDDMMPADDKSPVQAIETMPALATNNETDSIRCIIYPNPTHGFLQLQSTIILKDAQVELYDMSGRIIFSSKITLSPQSSFSINLHDFAIAIYILHVKSVVKNFHLKVVRW